MGEHAIDVKNISIHYRILNSASVRGGFWGRKKRNLVHEAVKDLSFSVDRGEVLGIVGKNGSGKSTLLRSIAGIFAPNVGEIDLHGYTVSLMALGIGFVSRLSGRENIMLSGMLLGFSEKAIREKMQEIIEFSELGEFIDRPVVLSVGDSRFQKKSFAKMRELITDVNTTVLIVSHSMETLRSLCDRVLWIHDGVMKEIGDTETVIQHYNDFMNK